MTETGKKNARDIELQHPLLRLVHRVLLAAIGAAMLAREEIEKFVESSSSAARSRKRTAKL